MEIQANVQSCSKGLQWGGLLVQRKDPNNIHAFSVKFLNAEVISTSYVLTGSVLLLSTDSLPACVWFPGVYVHGRVLATGYLTATSQDSNIGCPPAPLGVLVTTSGVQVVFDHLYAFRAYKAMYET